MIKKTHLLIGKHRTKSDPSKAGGVIVLFEQLISDFKRTNKGIKLVDLNRRNYPVPILVLFFVYLKLLFKIPKADIVFFNGTAQEYKYYAWFAVAYSKLLSKKVVLRKFAGNFDDYYAHHLNALSRRLVNYALKKADINYFETKYLISYFTPIANNCQWFPNVRPATNIKRSDKEYSKKFVFISHVTIEKGITEILEARKKLDESFTIDIFGPISYDCPENLKEEFNLCYKGTLPSRKVTSTLATYDFLLLPTYHKGEGYPGIIIEALSVGVPVIATPLKGIKEMIIENESGLFVQERDSDDLVAKMKKVNMTNYPLFSKNALEAFSNFDNEEVMKKVFNSLNK